MTDVKAFIAKYWPWLLGGAAGLYFISRSGGPGTNSYDYLAASQQAQIASSQMAAQNADVQRQYDIQQRALDLQEAQVTGELEAAKLAAQLESETQIAVTGIAGQTERYIADAQLMATQKSLETQQEIARVQSLAAIQNAQAAAGVEALHGYASIIDSMYQPGIAAINAATARDIATIEAAADIATANYYAQTALATTQMEIQGRLTDNYLSAGTGTVGQVRLSKAAGATGVPGNMVNINAQAAGERKDNAAKGALTAGGAAIGSIWGMPQVGGAIGGAIGEIFV